MIIVFIVSFYSDTTSGIAKPMASLIKFLLIILVLFSLDSGSMATILRTSALALCVYSRKLAYSSSICCIK